MDTGSADVHGTRVDWSLGQAGLREGVEPLLRFSPATGDVGVSWRVSAGPPAVFHERPAGVHFGRLSCEIRGDGAVHLVATGAGALVEAGGERVEIWGDDPAECRLAASLALHFTLYRRGLFHVHAGAVVDAGGSAILVVGPSGSGKTTTTLSLLEGVGEWRWLSDDAVYLSLEADVVRVRGLPAEFHVTEGTLRAFPFLRGHDLGAFAGSVPKRRVEPRAALAGREGVTAGAVDAILFPRVVPEGRTRLVEVEATRAYGMLLESSALALLRLPGHLAHLEALSTVVKRARCHALLLGSDALQSPALVAELVCGAWSPRDRGAVLPSAT